MKTIIKELLKFGIVFALWTPLFLYLHIGLCALGLHGYICIVTGHMITFSVIFLLLKFFVFKTSVNRI